MKNLWLKIKQFFCKHYVVPFDNDRTCMYCHKDMSAE